MSKRERVTFTLHRPKTARYSRRKTTLPMYWGDNMGDEFLTPKLDMNEQVTGYVTRFGYQRRRGGKPHDVYMVNGVLCEIQNVAIKLDDKGKPVDWQYAFVVCADRTVYDRYPHLATTLEGVVAHIKGGMVDALSCKVDGAEKVASADAIWFGAKAVGLA